MAEIEITHVRVRTNGHRMSYKEQITVESTEDMEALRRVLKKKYSANYVDFTFKTK